MAQERLQKIIARAGLASRRAAEKFIADGRVRVNGTLVRELGAQADAETDVIEVEGYGVLKPEQVVYIALHKPIHVVSTVRDPEGRRTVLDVLSESRPMGARKGEGELPRVYPVGRLDFDAEGLMLLTNDGDLANRLTHPRHHVPRTYMVKVRGKPEEKGLARLRRGVRLRKSDGSLTARPTKPAEVTVSKHSAANTWLEITLFEGRYHQVKRMCEAIGTRVVRLIRTEFGGVTVDHLDAGQWRFLTPQEVLQLKGWSERAQRKKRGRVDP